MAITPIKLKRRANYLNRDILFKKCIVVLTVIITTIGIACKGAQGKCGDEQPVNLVNPFIDTHSSRWFYFSSACRPFGMVNLSPDTDTKSTWNSGYLYGSNKIRCFSHVHAWQLAGIAVMPTTGPFKGHLGMDVYQSSFTHEGEIARPGYHQVYLSDYHIRAELTSTTRVGFHRYTFPKSDSSFILFDVGAFLAHGTTVDAAVKKVDDYTISGYQVLSKTMRRPKDTPVYFYAVFNKPFKDMVAWKDSVIVDRHANSIKGATSGAGFKFETTKGEQVLLKVAISYVSEEQARKNMEAELPHWDFDNIKKESSVEWNKLLGRIEIKGGTKQQKVKFYTDLWHALLGRRIVSDIDGRYMDRTGKNAVVRQVKLNKEGKPVFPHYNFDALWGSHWSLNILWSMVYPEIMDGFCNTMVDMYTNGGLIPRGPSGGNYTFVMIGDPAASFFAAAYNKGIRNYDVQKAYQGLMKNAFPGGIRDHAGYEHGPDAVGGGMKYYVDRGYVPEGIQSKGAHLDGASMTLEYAYQDWCLAQLSAALHKKDDFDLLIKRSKNYKSLWDPAINYIHPREMNGTFIPDFEPVAAQFNTRGFCEANASIYTYYVPHDIPGLITLFGGSDNYINRLNGMFEKELPNGFVAPEKIHAKPWVDYGNQPSTGLAHLFNWAGAPWLTQKWVRMVKAAFNDTTPYGGYNGDEDQGQMGALGVLMAIGIFEEDGGAAVKPTYEITSPIFDKITIELNPAYYTGKQFIIKTKNNSPENRYIQSATLNGQAWDKFWFYHETFAKGGNLEIVLGNTPNKNWGSKQ